MLSSRRQTRLRLAEGTDVREEDLHRSLRRAAQVFGALSFDERLSPADLLGLAVAGQPHPVIASLLERQGTGRGLLLARGPDALAAVMALLGDPAGLTARLAELEAITVTFAPWSEVPEPARHLLRRGGFSNGSAELAPVLLSHGPDRPPRALSSAEVALVTAALRGIALAQERGMLTVDRLRRSAGLMTLTIFGDPRLPEVSACFDGQAGEESPAETLSMPLEPSALAQRPRGAGRWLVGCPMLPTTSAETGEVARALVIVDHLTGQLIDGAAVTAGRRWPFAAASLLFDALVAIEGPLPGRISIVEREIDDLVGPALRSVGVAARHEPGVGRAVARAAERIVERMERRGDEDG